MNVSPRTYGGLMSEMRELLWSVVEQGARPVLRKHRFKRPGGGSRFMRDRAPLRQVISCRASWIGEQRTGHLQLTVEQRVEHHTLWSLHSPKMHVDLLNGDPKDAAIGVAHWLESTAIPELNQPLDLMALARAYEAESRPYRPRLSGLWAALGFPAEAARVAEIEAELDAEAPF